MQLDIYLPTRSLAFEYHGQQHYYDSYNIGPQWLYFERDLQKRESCSIKGITLIEIPYWWDLSEQSLSATIYQCRPDLIQKPFNAQPIPIEPLNKRLKKGIA